MIAKYLFITSFRIIKLVCKTIIIVFVIVPLHINDNYGQGID
ncbi:hypothetical protein [Parafilimonas sp.]